jgi:hypothetical protein
MKLQYRKEYQFMSVKWLQEAFWDILKLITEPEGEEIQEVNRLTTVREAIKKTAYADILT